MREPTTGNRAYVQLCTSPLKAKSIKACLAEALQLLFRKHNVTVTVPEE
jgi:hypothetical protein